VVVDRQDAIASRFNEASVPCFGRYDRRNAPLALPGVPFAWVVRIQNSGGKAQALSPQIQIFTSHTLDPVRGLRLEQFNFTEAFADLRNPELCEYFIYKPPTPRLVHPRRGASAGI
jgi:hypothetical protein